MSEQFCREYSRVVRFNDASSNEGISDLECPAVCPGKVEVHRLHRWLGWGVGKETLIVERVCPMVDDDPEIREVLLIPHPESTDT